MPSCKCTIQTLVWAAICLAVGSRVWGETATNSSGYHLEVVLDGDGVKEPRDETYFLGTNAVLRTIKSTKEVRVVLCLGRILVIQDDTNSDGVYDTLAVVQTDVSGLPSTVLHVFERDVKGTYRPISASRLRTRQKDAAKGSAFMRDDKLTPSSAAESMDR